MHTAPRQCAPAPDGHGARSTASPTAGGVLALSDGAHVDGRFEILNDGIACTIRCLRRSACMCLVGRRAMPVVQRNGRRTACRLNSARHAPPMRHGHACRLPGYLGNSRPTYRSADTARTPNEPIRARPRVEGARSRAHRAPSLLRRERERRTRYAKRFGHVLQRSFKQHLSYINGARAGGCRRKRRHTVRHSTGRACTRTPRSHADRLTCSPCGSGGSMELRFAKPRARGATFLGMLRCLQGIQIVPRVRRRRLQHGHLGDGV